jgi:uncharacterized protein
MPTPIKLAKDAWEICKRLSISRVSQSKVSKSLDALENVGYNQGAESLGQTMNSRVFEFERDAEKASLNERRHGVRLEQAETAFDDPYARVGYDPDHSVAEHRLILIGHSSRNRLPLTGSATFRLIYRTGGAYPPAPWTARRPVQACRRCKRIISARKATTKEREGYEEREE